MAGIEMLFGQLERKTAMGRTGRFYMLLEQGISSSPPRKRVIVFCHIYWESVLQEGMWMLERHSIEILNFYSKEDMLRSVLEGVGHNLEGNSRTFRTDKAACAKP